MRAPQVADFCAAAWPVFTPPLTDGLDPRLAQPRVILFFCPILASSWNQISITLPLAGPSAISATAAGKFF